MNQEEQKNVHYEINSKLTFGNGFDFGFGFGIGFFISGIIISIVIGFIVFALFGAALYSFQKSISDPFGLKGSSYSQPMQNLPSGVNLDQIKGLLK